MTKVDKAQNMTGFLPDANVRSEPFRVDPEPLVLDFLTRQPDLWLSSIVLHELQFLDLMPRGRRQDQVREQFVRLTNEYSDRVIGVDPAEARLAAGFRAARQRAGRPLHLADALIALAPSGAPA